MDKLRLSEADRVSSLLLKKMAGTITPEEQAEIDIWQAQSRRRQTYANQLSDTNFLQEEYHRQKGIDAHRAMRRMQQRIDESRKPLPSVLRHVVAAVLTVFIVGGLFWYWQYSQIIPPSIPAEIRQAMARSTESGRQEAQIERVVTAKQDKQNIVKTLKQKYNITSDGVVEQLLEARRITTRSDREFWLTLPDGSLVHLNYNTRVIYPERFSGPTRDIILDGEAYFMVAKDRRHPFIVHTRQGDIKEYGTEFNVNSRASETANSTEVVLVEGSVSVTPVNGTEKMMKPGQKFNVQSSNISIEEVDVSPYVAWNTGDFMFTDQPLEKVMDVMARWYGLSIEYTSDDIRDMRVSGAVGRYNSINDTMEAIEMVTGLRIAINQDRIIISN